MAEMKKTPISCKESFFVVKLDDYGVLCAKIGNIILRGKLYDKNHAK